MNYFEPVCKNLEHLVHDWEPKLRSLSEETITQKRNNQNRTIKQITGHLIDSTSNNIHRIVHLQYQELPLVFPNYASFGNNDRWISIQDYQNEDWNALIQLLKFSLLHLIHVIKNVKPEMIENEWVAGPGRKITLRSMIEDFPRHLELHLSEINDLAVTAHR